MHYFEWLERTTAAPFVNETEVTTAADVSVNEPSGNVSAEGGVNETVSGVNVTSNATGDSVDANATISDGNVTTDLTGNVTKDEDDVMAVDRDADEDVTSGDGEMITGKMEEVVKAVTERFLAATKGELGTGYYLQGWGGGACEVLPLLKEGGRKRVSHAEGGAQHVLG